MRDINQSQMRHEDQHSQTLETNYPLTEELSDALSEALQKTLGTVQQRSLPLEGGHILRYEVLGKQSGPTLVLANGLGGRLYTWLPFIEAFSAQMKIITWDYRGLFDSHSASPPQNLTIPKHADDLMHLLRAEHVERVHLFGWSMGVQVGLEFASRYPEHVESLVLINGTYGQVFSTAFQPWLRVPFPTWTLHELIEALRRFEGVTRFGLKSMSVPVEFAFFARSQLVRSQQPLLMLAARQYCRDLLNGEHLSAYLTFFQHLDAHSVYHLLPQIQAPTLVISGGIDFLTPPYQSRQIARRIPTATHHNIKLGSHFVLLERSQRVLSLIQDHLSPFEIC